MRKVWRLFSSRSEADITTLSVIASLFHQDLAEFSKSDEELFYTYCDDRNGTNYIAVSMHDFGKFLFDKYIKNDRSRIEKILQRGDEINRLSEKLITSWQKGSRKLADLQKLYQSFLPLYEEIAHIYTVMLFTVVEYWQEDFSNLLEKLIRQNHLNNLKDKIYNSALQPIKKTALSKIKDELASGADPLVVLKKYQFLRTWTLVWYKELGRRWIMEITEQNNNLQKDLFSSRELIKLLNPSVQEKKIFGIAPSMVYLKDYRDEIRRRFAYLWSETFHDIAKQCRVEYDDLGYLSIYEIAELFSGGNFQKTINRRKTHPIVATVDRESHRIKLIESDLAPHYRDWRNELDPKNVKEFDGISAYAGKISGQVAIINSGADVNFFPQGKILVANSTHPDYLPAMQKAIAFVTNEGGLLCHVAIISRELKKPCIVGTKIATKMLKDGDKIEVDANKGTVKIIKRA